MAGVGGCLVTCSLLVVQPDMFLSKQVWVKVNGRWRLGQAVESPCAYILHTSEKAECFQATNTGVTSLLCVASAFYENMFWLQWCSSV